MSTALARDIFGKTAGDRRELAAVMLPDVPGEDEETSSAFVGNLFWFTIPRVQVSPDAFAEGFAAAGIDSKYLPGKIHPSNAFRSASKKLEQSKDITINDRKARVSLLVRPVDDNAAHLVRHVVVEIVDAANVRLLYTEAVQLELLKAGAEAMVNELPGMEELPKAAADFVREIAGGFPGEYAVQLENLNDGYVRRALQALMSAEHVIRLRDDGVVHFALTRHEHVVKQLAAFFEWFRQLNPRAKFVDAPLVDMREKRQMVAEETAEHVKGEVGRLVKEIDGLLLKQKDGRKIRTKTVDGYLDELGRLTSLVGEYRSATRDHIVEAATQIEILQHQIVELQLVSD